MSALKRGFTLLELILVIAVIALLVGIVAPRFTSQVPKAEIATTQANLENLRKAVAGFQADKGSYPRQLPDLVAEYMRQIPEPAMKDASGKKGEWWYSQATGEVKLSLGGRVYDEVPEMAPAPAQPPPPQPPPRRRHRWRWF